MRPDNIILLSGLIFIIGIIFYGKKIDINN